MAECSVERRDFYVYILFRTTGIPLYVGKGCRSRMTEHEREAKRGSNTRISRVIRKMLSEGEDIPKVKIRSGLTHEEAFEIEIAFIAAIGREPCGPLINITPGGLGASGYKLTDEQRAKMRASHLGKKQSAEWVAKRIAATAAAHRGMKRTAETRAGISERLKGNTYAKGNKFSDEARAKLSQARKGRKLSAAHAAAIAAGLRGKKKSPEHVASMIKARARKKINGIHPDLFD